MPRAEDGDTYAAWLEQAESSDEFAQKGAEYALVTLYDGNGRAQLVRGSSVKPMLAKRDSEDSPVFFGEAPE
tara:strand:+ start:85 stop:300 length:216 start_codon:yes stop_codon:yes gene_type:complete